MQEVTPVLFRLSDGEVTAVFPTIPDGEGGMMCYAHIGQHSGCSFGWYRTTKCAAQYADLQAELESIGYVLKMYKRLTPQLRVEWRKAEREQQQPRESYDMRGDDLGLSPDY